MKKYLTHIISISFLIFLNILIYVMSNNNNVFNDREYLIIPLIIVEVIFVVGIIAEIVYYFYKLSKNQELKSNPLYYVLIYFFNIFYIPCLCLKHIYKDSKYKSKNAFFIIIMIILYVILMINLITFSIDTLVTEYTSKDGNVTLSLSNNYEEKKVGYFDIYFASSTLNVGLMLYGNEGYSAEEILDFQTNFIYDTRENVKSISESDKTIDDRKIKTAIVSGMNDDIENVYMMSTITSSKIDNYVVYVIEITTKDNYPSEKNEMQKVLENIVINS